MDRELRRATHVEGEWKLGRSGGRGVWWCAEGDCASQMRVDHLARALKFSVTSDDLMVWRELTTGTKNVRSMEE